MNSVVFLTCVLNRRSCVFSASNGTAELVFGNIYRSHYIYTPSTKDTVHGVCLSLIELFFSFNVNPTLTCMKFVIYSQ